MPRHGAPSRETTAQGRRHHVHRRCASEGFRPHYRRACHTLTDKQQHAPRRLRNASAGEMTQRISKCHHGTTRGHQCWEHPAQATRPRHRGDAEHAQPSRKGEEEHHHLTSVPTICMQMSTDTTSRPPWPRASSHSGVPQTGPPAALSPPRPAPCRPLPPPLPSLRTGRAGAPWPLC